MALTSSTKVGEYLQKTFDGSSTPTSTTVTTWIGWGDAEIERRTGQKFESTVVTDIVLPLSRYSTTLDLDAAGAGTYTNPRSDSGFHQAHGFKVKLPGQYRPLISLEEVSRNTAGPTSADSWESLTENTGSGGDYFIDLNEAEISILNKTPRYGRRAIRVDITYGYATVPPEVEALATMLAAKRVLMSSFSNAQDGNWDSVSVADISLTKGGAAGLSAVKTMDIDINSQWEVVGRLYSDLV